MKLLKIYILKTLLTSHSGFTFIEVLVAIAILVMIISLGLFMSMDVFRGYLHRSERDTVVSILSQARSDAINNICIGSACADGKAHGVCLLAPNYIIFQGATYNAGMPMNQIIPGNSAIDIASNHSSFFTCGTGTGAVFDQLTGKLSPQLSLITDELKITISEPGRPDSVITINNEGRINW